MSTSSSSSTEHTVVCKKQSFFTRQLIIDVTIWTIVCIPVLVFFICGQPYTQGFYCDDVSIQRPYKKDTISTPVLLAGGLCIPLLMLFLTEIVSKGTDRENPLKSPRHEIYMALKGFGIFLFGTMVCKVFTEVTKYTVGRLRPNFIDVCRPDFSRINCSLGYISDYVCQSTVHTSREIRDSRLSFPSGHASFAVFCSVFTVLYIQERMKIKSSYFLKPTIQSAALLLSAWCCLTRVTDHKHFPSDVIAGAVMGAVSGILTFYKVGLPVFRAPTVSRPDVQRGYSVNSQAEPKTPDPLLRNNTCSFYLNDPIFEKDTTRDDSKMENGTLLA